MQQLRPCAGDHVIKYHMRRVGAQERLHPFFRDTVVDRDHVRKYTLETSECWKAAVMTHLRKHYFTIC